MRALAALTMITAVLLTGCSSKPASAPAGYTQGPTDPPSPPPVPTSVTTPNDAKVTNPRKTGGKLDCAQVTDSMVSQAVADPVAVDPTNKVPGMCAFRIPKSAGPSGDGTITLSLTNGTLWDRAADLDGNSAAQQATASSGSCDLMVALNQGTWLRVRVLLYDNPAKGDVCTRARTLAKSVMDKLPPGTEEPVDQMPSPQASSVKRAPKKLPLAIDHAKLLPFAQLINTLGKTGLELTPSGVVTVPSTEPGGTPGSVSVIHGTSGGTETEFQGYTAYERKDADTLGCTYALAVAEDKWVQVRVVIMDKDHGDVCMKTRSVLKIVYEQLEDA
nr:DUF3558 family protein [Kibdelosporangium sp. MJ126-NF4]CEL15491.1 hypothetical protein [Kibdelosporangium sp. MJ126-NF4]CTQ92107.1 hypothetical protein [Kibdelosporangium sp. MJ126-NF4]